MRGRLPVEDLDAAIDRVAGDLAALDGARLLLTGGTGFFGRALLALLARAQELGRLDLAVTVPSRDPARFAAARPDLAALPFLSLVSGDVRELGPTGERFTHVIHAATDTDRAPEDDPLGLIATVIDGTRAVLDVAAASGCPRLLYLSSGAVYGGPPSGAERIAETDPASCDPLDPRQVYGGAKRLAEQLCALATARGDAQAVIARCFAFLGPGLPLGGHFAAGNFIRDALDGRPVTVSGDGSPVRSYLYVGDLAAWLLALLVRGVPGQAYNVGSDEGVALADLARRVARVVPGAGEVVVLGRPDPAAHRSRYVPAIDRARGLGLDVWTPLDVAIARTAAFTDR